MTMTPTFRLLAGGKVAMLVLIQLLLLLLSNGPAGSGGFFFVAAQAGGPFAELNITEEIGGALLAQCGVPIFNLSACVFPGGVTNTSQAFIGDCQGCLEKNLNATGGGNGNTTTTGPVKVSCPEVDAQIEKGLNACTKECAVEGCIPVVTEAFQCIFRTIVNCTTGQIILSQSPVAAPVSSGGGSGPGKESSTNGSNTPPTPDSSGAKVMMCTWWGAAAVNLVAFLVAILVVN